MKIQMLALGIERGSIKVRVIAAAAEASCHAPAPFSGISGMDLAG